MPQDVRICQTAVFQKSSKGAFFNQSPLVDVSPERRQVKRLFSRQEIRNCQIRSEYMYRKFPHFYLAIEGSKGAVSPQSFPGEMTHWLCGFQRLFNSIFVRFQNRRDRVSVGGQLRSLFPSFPGERFNSLPTHSLSCLNFIQPMKAIRNQDGTARV